MKTKSNTSWGFSNANTDKIFAFIHRCIRTGFCSPDLDSYPDRISRITDCNFTVRMLYHNMYWLLYILDLRFVLFMYNCSLTVRNKQICYVTTKSNMHTHTHTRLTVLCPRLPRWAGTRKVKPIWILLEQEIVSGSGISWACASLHLAPDR